MNEQKALGKRKKGTLKRLEEELEQDPVWQEEFEGVNVQPEFQSIEGRLKMTDEKVEQAKSILRAISGTESYLVYAVANAIRVRTKEGAVFNLNVEGDDFDRTVKVTDVAASGVYIAACTDSGHLHFCKFDASGLIKLPQTTKRNEPISYVAFGPDMFAFAYNKKYFVTRWGGVIPNFCPLKTTEEKICGIDYDSEGRLALAFPDSIEIGESGKKLKIEIEPENPFEGVGIRSISFSPDNKYMAVVNRPNESPGELRVYELDYENLTSRLVDKSGPIVYAGYYFGVHWDNDKIITCAGEKVQTWKFEK
jgi:hypothetical protein